MPLRDLLLARAVPASRVTTWRLGGEIGCLYTALSPAGLDEALARLAEIPGWRLLGGGSNLLVSERGVAALLRLGGSFVSCRADGELLVCGGGLTGGTAVRRAVEAGLSGLEPFVGLPGTVGGWAATNGGPAGEDTLSRVAWVMARPLAGGERRRLRPAEIEHGYRHSALRDGWVVEEVAFRLAEGDSTGVRRLMRRQSRVRRATQPNGASAGCVFRNPPGDAAGRLIDETGLKGEREGGVEVSRRHANFMLNRGDGTAGDAWRLIRRVRTAVEDATGVLLSLEVEPVGRFAGA